ncbi:unnamed protein product, partial [Rotaria sordida]
DGGVNEKDVRYSNLTISISDH